MKTTDALQVKVDSVVLTLNEAICEYHSRGGDELLVELPKDRRIVIVKPLSELKDYFDVPLDHSSAFYHFNTGLIYIVEDNFCKSLEMMSTLRQKMNLSDDVSEEVTLLDILSHENVHRSCAPLWLPASETDFYYYGAQQFFEDTPVEAKLKSLQEAGKRIESCGLRLYFEDHNGKYNVGRDRLDEFVTNYIAGSMLAPFLEKRGYFSPQTALFALLLTKIRDDATEFSQAIKVMKRSDFDERRFGADYLGGRIPLKIISSLVEEVDEATEALVANLTGDLESLNAITALYTR